MYPPFYLKKSFQFVCGDTPHPVPYGQVGQVAQAAASGPVLMNGARVSESPHSVLQPPVLPHMVTTLLSVDLTDTAQEVNVAPATPEAIVSPGTSAPHALDGGSGSVPVCPCNGPAIQSAGAATERGWAVGPGFPIVFKT